jgi:ribosomal protein S20
MATPQEAENTLNTVAVKMLHDTLFDGRFSHLFTASEKDNYLYKILAAYRIGNSNEVAQIYNEVVDLVRSRSNYKMVEVIPSTPIDNKINMERFKNMMKNKKFITHLSEKPFEVWNADTQSIERDRKKKVISRSKANRKKCRCK